MPLATVNQTFDVVPLDVPMASLLPVVHDEPWPGAPRASPAANEVAGTATVSTIAARQGPTKIRNVLAMPPVLGWVLGVDPESPACLVQSRHPLYAVLDAYLRRLSQVMLWEFSLAC